MVTFYCNSHLPVDVAERTIAPQEGDTIMKLGMLLRTSAALSGLDMDAVLEAERLGYDSAWAGEAYGSDAVTPIAWVLARTVKIKGGTSIMQMPARTPACAAMTAMSLQALSGGRFLCGLGPSGPQVVEGWHGQPFGKPLKSIMHPNDDLKIYTAAISPAGLRTAGEVADGVLPFIMSPERADLIARPVEEGMGKASKKKTLADFDIAPYVRIRIGDDVAACRDSIRPELAFYIGGMGARDKNFYNDLAMRMGYEAAAREIQDLFLSGKRQEAAAAVPDALIDETCLVGPKSRIKDQLEAWKAIARENKIGTLLLSGITIESARVVAEAVL